MVKLNRIYTRTGDDGTTGLVGTERRSKASARVEAIGAADEANSALGLARLHAPADLQTLLERLQSELFDLGADLATPLEPATDYEPLRIIESQVRRLEADIDRLNAELRPLASFILPGGGAAGVSLHLARTSVRRAERCAFALAEDEGVNPQALSYLNRLSDLLFVAARHASGGDETLWKPGSTRG